MLAWRRRTKVTLGDILAPPATRGGAGISPNCRSRFCGPGARGNEKNADLLPELSGAFVCFPGFAKVKFERKRENPPIKRLDTLPAAGRVADRERVRQLVGEHDDQVVMLIWGRPDSRLVAAEDRGGPGRVDRASRSPRRVHSRPLDSGYGPADLPPAWDRNGSSGRSASCFARLSETGFRSPPVEGEGRIQSPEARGRSG